MSNDRAFVAALSAGDAKALAAEIHVRLDACIYGTGVHFRRDWQLPTVWCGTARGKGSEHHAAMAKAAAAALLAAA